MPFAFNKPLWELGRKIEDAILPELNKAFECNFERNENDIFDIFDFKDENEKKIVEVKGRRIASTQYKDTIITTSKITNGFQAIDQGYKVFLVFVFTDKALYHELKEDDSFECKLTGTNCIQHYMIPIANLKEFDYEECEPEEIISEE
tara:strand:- start:3347 stop:3790 length:444 start_codon:yes stop_codon:yes gene_type:complete